MEKKRGSIEIQFNWIFVFVVGAIILLFFTRVTFKQKEVSEAKIAISVLTDLDTITTGAASSRSTAQIVDIPEVDMTFTASPDDCYRTYKIGPNARRIENNFIFSPGRIEGRKLLSWTEDWSLPYRVTNFVYMTSPLVRYIIVDDGDGYASALMSTVPEELNARLVSPGSDVINLNNYKVRFVFFNGNPEGFSVDKFRDMDDRDVTAVNLIPNAENSGNTGSVVFYRKDGSSLELVGSSYYVKKESMYAAIFSDTPEIYNCNMQAAFERLRFVSQLYLNRTTLLEAVYRQEPCGSYYYLACCTSSDPKIPRIIDIADMLSKQFPPAGGDSAVKELYDKAYLADTDRSNPDYSMEGVKMLNDYVLFNSCPEIY